MEDGGEEKSAGRFSMKDIQSFVNKSSGLQEMAESKGHVFEMNLKIDDDTEEIEIYEQPSGPQQAKPHPALSDRTDGLNPNDAELLGLKYFNRQRPANLRDAMEDLKLNINPSLLAYHQQRDIHSKQTSGRSHTNKDYPGISRDNSIAKSPSEYQNSSKCSDLNNPLLKHLDLDRNSNLNFSENDSGLLLRKLDPREIQLNMHSINADCIIASSKERQKLFQE
jgi:hypothetical protein